MDFEANRVGLIERVYWNAYEGASHGHGMATNSVAKREHKDVTVLSLDISYNETDRVEGLRFNAPYGSVTSDFRYTPRGFREFGRYDLLEQMGRGEVSLSYDAVGNLVQWSYPAPDASAHLIRHTVGPQNQVLAVTAIGHEQFEQTIDYDPSGRPVRALQGGRREANFRYDELGRLTDVYLDGKHVLTAEHGAMDVDPVHEADMHTPFTTIDQPVGSAVFGSLEEIAFTRTAGSAYGFVQFVPAMARFVIRDQLVAPPDAIVLASLKRRNLASRATLNPSPLLGFDRASSSLFFPAEYFSVNCFTCYEGVTGFDLDRVGSGLVSTGQTVDFVADAASSYCNSYYYDPETFEGNDYPEQWMHRISINGDYLTTYYGPLGYTNHEYLEFGLLFSTPGEKTVRDTLQCSCKTIFSTSAEEAVEVCQAPIPTIIGEYQTYAVALDPTCNDFTQTRSSAYFSFNEILDGAYSWALIKDPLVAPAVAGYGLDRWREEYGSPLSITSGYRSPAYNQQIGGAGQSQHMYGTAADVDVVSNQQAEWTLIRDAALDADPDFVEGLNDPCGTNCVHADWRDHAGDYQP